MNLPAYELVAPNVAREHWFYAGGAYTNWNDHCFPRESQCKRAGYDFWPIPISEDPPPGVAHILPCRACLIAMARHRCMS